MFRINLHLTHIQNPEQRQFMYLSVMLTLLIPGYPRLRWLSCMPLYGIMLRKYLLYIHSPSYSDHILLSDPMCSLSLQCSECECISSLSRVWMRTGPLVVQTHQGWTCPLDTSTHPCWNAGTEHCSWTAQHRSSVYCPFHI